MADDSWAMGDGQWGMLFRVKGGGREGGVMTDPDGVSGGSSLWGVRPKREVEAWLRAVSPCG
jgi:hypothetical protein